MNGNIGVHGCSLVGVERPVVFGTVFYYIHGGLYSFHSSGQIWAAANVAVEDPTSGWFWWLGCYHPKMQAKP